MLKKTHLSLMFYFFMVLTAKAASNSSSISVDVGSDEQGNKNTFVAVELTLNNAKKFMFGAGRSVVLTGAENIDNNFLYFGLSKKVSEDWKVTGMLEYSDFKDEFSMTSTSLPVRYSQDIYYIEVIPGLRTITLANVANKNNDVSSAVLGFKSGIYMGEHFRLNGSAYSYSYSRDVSNIGTFSNARFFNESTLPLTSGLLTSSTNIETGLDFNAFSVSLGKNSSISAIDNSNSDYIYTVFDYYLSKAWGVSVLFGEYLNTPEDENNFSSVSVNYSF